MLKQLLILITLILPSTVAAQQQAIVVVGDSLSAAYGMTQKEGWVNLMAIKMKAAALPYYIVNTSISGETTHGALARFSAIISAHQPAIVIIALGGNDGLRGMPLKAMKQNLASMIKSAQASHADVLLAGMQLPPNYGRTFTQKFSRSYQQLADEHNVALLPFLLKGMELDLALFQPDGIHPLSSAQSIIVENVWYHLLPLLTTTP